MSGTKLKSTRIIIIGAVTTLLAIVILVFSNFYFLKITNSNLAEIDEVYTKKLDIILNMTHIVRERSMDMLTMYLEEDDWRVDEYFMKYHRLAVEFITLRDQLIGLGLTAREEEELKKALAFIRKTEPIQNEIVERIHSGDNTNVKHDISRKDLPLEYDLLGIFDELAAIVRQNAHKGRLRAQAIYTRSIFTVAVVSLLIAAVIIILMYRSLKQVQSIERGLINEASSLSWKATHDPLTNIYNRRWLEHKIDQIHQAEDIEHTVHSLIYIDLDDFKPINDFYGHTAGDLYLKRFCQQIEQHIRHNDTFARLGGDEFVILLENCNRDKAMTIAETILSDIRQFTILFEGNRISANCSIGLLEFGTDIRGVDDLLKQADALCYEAKRQGKNAVCCQSCAS